MDCPICFETITKETGQVTTSCGHSFHFKCLNTWYWRQTQNEDTNESCPCCRKEPGDYERASTVTGTIEDAESETLSEESSPEWIQVGPRRWVIGSGSERLRILADVAVNEEKIDPYYIPPYNGEAHALWILRHLFEEPIEPATQQEVIDPLDRPKLLRKRCDHQGRTFWSHMGNEYKLHTLDGYKSD
jgi:hypothetical protein